MEPFLLQMQHRTRISCGRGCHRLHDLGRDENVIVDRDTYMESVYTQRGKGSRAYFESHSQSCKSRSVDDSTQTCRFYHIVLSSGKEWQEQGVTNIPQRDDDELRVLGPIFDVIGDDGYVPEIERSVDLVHKVKRGRLCDQINEGNLEIMYDGKSYLEDVERKHKGQRTQRLRVTIHVIIS